MHIARVTLFDIIISFLIAAAAAAAANTLLSNVQNNMLLLLLEHCRGHVVANLGTRRSGSPHASEWTFVLAYRDAGPDPVRLHVMLLIQVMRTVRTGMHTVDFTNPLEQPLFTLFLFVVPVHDVIYIKSAHVSINEVACLLPTPTRNSNEKDHGYGEGRGTRPTRVLELTE